MQANSRVLAHRGTAGLQRCCFEILNRQDIQWQRENDLIGQCHLAPEVAVAQVLAVACRVRGSSATRA